MYFYSGYTKGSLTILNDLERQNRSRKQDALKVQKADNIRIIVGQWLCGSVGRAVASNTRGLRFESSHLQKFIYIEHSFSVNCVLKRRK